MKIVYVANLRLPTEKAHGLQIMKMCEALARQKIELELVVPKRAKDILMDPFEYWGIERKFQIKEIGNLDFLNIELLPRFLAFFLHSIYFSVASFFYLKKIKNFDYIYTRDREIACLAFLLKRPLIFEIHILPKFLFFYSNLFKRIYRIVTINNYAREKFLLLLSSISPPPTITI